MFTFKTITKNGSILGRIPHKSSSSSLSNMSSNDATDYYSSGSESAGSTTYYGRSPRAAPRASPRTSPRAAPSSSRSSSSRSGSSRSSSSREEPPARTTTTTTTTSTSGTRVRVNMSVAIAEYRSHTMQPPRLVRENARLHDETRSSSRTARESSGSDSSAARPRYLTTSRRSQETVPLAASPRRRNPADFSDSDSSPASSWSSSGPDGELAKLAPVVRDLVESSRRSGRGSHDDRHSRLAAAPAEGESFFPNPKVTFLLDSPQNLRCQICMSTPLALAKNADRAGEQAPAILPCGHVACFSCMYAWLDEHPSCPFCRMDMTHKGCGHAVEPRILSPDQMLTLARTIPEGGCIGPECQDCRLESLHALALAQWKALAKSVRDARHADQERSSDATRAALKKAVDAFENAPSHSTADLSAKFCSTW